MLGPLRLFRSKKSIFTIASRLVYLPDKQIGWQTDLADALDALARMRLKCRTFYAGCTTFRASKRASKDMRIALSMPMLHTNHRLIVSMNGSVFSIDARFTQGCSVYPRMPGYSRIPACTHGSCHLFHCQNPTIGALNHGRRHHPAW